MTDKELALRNVIANQALEGLEMTADEIKRSRAILSGDLSIDGAVAEIHRELQASDRSTAKPRTAKAAVFACGGRSLSDLGHKDPPKQTRYH